MKNPFEILGVSASSSEKEIKEAWHNAQKKYHPDRFPDPDEKKRAKQKIREINLAYDQIKKSKSQENFYEGGFNPFSQYSSADNFSEYSNDPGIFDLFSSFFGGSDFSQRIRQKCFFGMREFYKGGLKTSLLYEGKKIEVVVPNGIAEGEFITIDLQGRSKKIKLDLIIGVREEKGFYKVNNNLYSILEVNRGQVTPVKIKIYTLDNFPEEIYLSNPPKFGEVLTLKSKGFINPDGRTRGNWYLIVNNDPNSNSRKILESYLSNISNS